MGGVIRLGLTVVLLLVSGVLIATHGIRGLAVIAGVALLATVPRTQVWRTSSGALVRLTGSRQRAAALVLGVIICALVAVNVYELVR